MPSLDIMMTEFKYQVNKRYDRFLLWIAYHLPKRVVMWCTIRVINNACHGEYSNQNVSTLTAAEAIDRWPTR